MNNIIKIALVLFFIVGCGWSQFNYSHKEFIKDDQNNIDACNGKILSLIGLNKFKEAKDFISILPEEILNNNKIKDLSSKIEVAEKSFEASKNFVHLEKALYKSRRVVVVFVFFRRSSKLFP